MIDPRMIDSFKNRIVEVIDAYVPLTRIGTNWKGLCPWHDDRHPSFTVSERKRIWRCWPCCEGGDVIGFLMKYLGVDFRQALKILGVPMLHIDGPSASKVVRQIDLIKQWKYEKLAELKECEEQLQFLSRRVNCLINSTPPLEREAWIYSSERWLDEEFDELREKREEITRVAQQQMREVQS